MEIIGYANPNKYYPSPLITFAKKDDISYVIYPSTKVIKIDNFDSVFSDVPHFIKEDSGRYISDGAYAFAVSEGTIFIDTPERVREELSSVVKNNIMIGEDLEILEEYLENTIDDVPPISENKKKIFWLDYIEMLKNYSNVRVLITKRRVFVRGQYFQAERLIIQLFKSSGFKSHLRKNLHHDENIESLATPDRDILPAMFSGVELSLDLRV